MNIAQEIELAFSAQQIYRYTLRKFDESKRIATLKSLKQVIKKYESKIYEALQHDLRKSNFESAVTEVIFVYAELDHAIQNLGSWMKPKRIGTKYGSMLLVKIPKYQP